MLSFLERVSYGTHADLSMFGEEGVALMRPSDLLILEWVFHQNREIKHIVEVGTGHGLSTLYLSQVCRLRGGELHTFDHHPPRQAYRDLWPDCARFHEADVLTEECQELIPFIARPRSLVMLDDGNKPRELELYAKHLPCNSVLAVHDFGSEVAPKCDWAKIVSDAGLEPYLWEESVEWHSQVRCWRRPDPVEQPPCGGEAAS
jgi:hypothetical protein